MNVLRELSKENVFSVFFFFFLFYHFEECKGKDTLWNISFRLLHETQFNAYFITYNWISRNSCKICEKESLYLEYVISKNTTKQKTKRKRSIRVKPWLKIVGM